MTIQELLKAKIIKAHKKLSVLKVEGEKGDLIAELYINKLYEMFDYYIVNKYNEYDIIAELLSSKITYIKALNDELIIRCDY